jgi:hypothetical protein
MPFDVSKCEIRTFYCGKGNIPEGSTRKGNNYECLRRGFGAGKWQERVKNLPAKSLQRIKYVGPKFEKNFKEKNINNTDQLISKLSIKTKDQKKKILEKIFTRKNNTIDYRGYNNVLLFLHVSGVKKLPSCKEIEI